MDKPSGKAGGSSRARPDRGRTHRGLTCANCRSRKTRCDGGQPSCKTCEVYQDECRYEKPPPMSQITSMARKLQEAEQTIAELKGALESRPPHPGASDSQAGYEPSQSSVSPILSKPVPGVQHDFVPQQARSPSSERASGYLLSDLSLDEHGKISYHGPTSAIHDPPSIETPSPLPQPYDEQSLKLTTRTLLSSSAQESRAWEDFALGNASSRSDIPKDVMSKLLQIHWVWIAPMFMWVYRPAFIRDMATDGPYYSPFLLTVLCGHAAHFHESHVGDMLINRARLLLGTEIHKPSTIPTVQGLLQLSARELALGSTSQAWLYSGMAFRMASDLGLHHNSSQILSLGCFSHEDLEIRRRLFWSCYFWDKAISLYLGRAPALTELPFDHTLEFFDNQAENEIWSPHNVESFNRDRVFSAGEYPPTKAHCISCFENSCKLAVILNDIICQLYSRRAVTDNENALRGIHERLEAWRSTSPPHLKLDPDNLPDVCCPPHVLTQNLLYFTTIILLHRPFYSSPTHHLACRQAADRLERLLLLLEKTFGFSHLTYLMAYCIYAGASVMIRDVKAADADASAKMQTFLRALSQGRAACPLLQRSLDIINNSLRSDGSPFASTAPATVPPPGSRRFAAPATETGASAVAESGDNDGGGRAAPAPLLAGNYLPAFPYLDLQVGSGLGPSDTIRLTGADVDHFSILDCFPENHMDNASAEWYMPP